MSRRVIAKPTLVCTSVYVCNAKDKRRSRIQKTCHRSLCDSERCQKTHRQYRKLNKAVFFLNHTWQVDANCWRNAKQSCRGTHLSPGFTAGLAWWRRHVQVNTEWNAGSILDVVVIQFRVTPKWKWHKTVQRFKLKDCTRHLLPGKSTTREDLHFVEKRRSASSEKICVMWNCAWMHLQICCTTGYHLLMLWLWNLSCCSRFTGLKQERSHFLP